MRRQTAFAILGLTVGFSVTPAQAEIPVAHHLTLIGVISDGSQRGAGVAVVRDKATEKTLMLKQGEALPDGSGFVVKSISRKFVLAANGAALLRLEHAPAGRDEDDEAKKEELAMENEADEARSQLERLLMPLMRRTLVVPGGEDDEPLNFETLHAELIDTANQRAAEDASLFDEGEEASGY